MESGTFAVDPDPWGGPWRMWDEIDPGEAEARGIYAPVHALSDSRSGAIVIAPGDVRGTRLIPERCGGACCGLSGADGPNMACEACDLPVATRVDDCSLWQAVRLSSDAVRRVPVDGVHAAPLSWAELTEKGESTPRSSRSPHGEDGSGRVTTGRGVRDGRRQRARRSPTCSWPPQGNR